ncbi:hypothetical protein DCC62_00455 [candidate division KSB1 bacterium]|nr:MAG: hypothetical protein DCC62_00455 [candidate division KSB1 bacterium]
MTQAYPIQNRLRKYRKHAGITQQEVARRVGVSSPSQVSRWERGERLPNLTQALRLSALYNRMVNDLFFDLFDDERGRVAYSPLITLD